MNRNQMISVKKFDVEVKFWQMLGYIYLIYYVVFQMIVIIIDIAILLFTAWLHLWAYNVGLQCGLSILM